MWQAQIKAVEGMWWNWDCCQCSADSAELLSRLIRGEYFQVLLCFCISQLGMSPTIHYSRQVGDCHFTTHRRDLVYYIDTSLALLLLLLLFLLLLPCRHSTFFSIPPRTNISARIIFETASMEQALSLGLTKWLNDSCEMFSYLARSNE